MATRITTGVTMTPKQLVVAKERAKSMGFSFSLYIRHLIERDLLPPPTRGESLSEEVRGELRRLRKTTEKALDELHRQVLILQEEAQERKADPATPEGMKSRLYDFEAILRIQGQILDDNRRDIEVLRQKKVGIKRSCLAK